MKESKKENKKRGAVGAQIFKWTNFALLIIYCFSLLLPLVWMLYTSCKIHSEYVMSSFAFPKKWTLSNFKEAFDKLKLTINVPQGIVQLGIGNMTLNSLARSVCCSLLTVFCTACVAYVVGMYEFVGRKFIYNLGIVVMILPIIGSLPSAMVVRKALNIYDNMFLYILTSPSNVFGMNFLILYGAFRGLPKAYMESAKIDGAGHHRIFYQIYLPMMIPTCVVLFVLQFLTSWNDYLTPMIWLPSYPNLAYGMYYFERNAAMFEANVPTIMAGFTIVMIPTALLYICSQKLIVQKFTVGGLKG